MTLQRLAVFFIGVSVGFLGGLFGKGGSAIATPLLSLIGLPGFVAVAAPLPATVPGTMIAALAYSRSRLLDWELTAWSVAIGLPATLVGAYLTNYTGERPLLLLTGLLVFGFGVSFLVRHIQPQGAVTPAEEQSHAQPSDEAPEGEPRGLRSLLARGSSPRPSYWRLRLVLVAGGIGLVSGLLANSGGFLLAPSYVRIMHLPLKRAFASSLVVSMVLAIPGTVMHAHLGHIDWWTTAILALGSVPLSYVGARVAIAADARILERAYGVLLTLLGGYFLIQLLWNG
ncbi:MAG: sulfite exporter TauE/SafE family protein [Coriobacteriia bacterium]|jgi:uncharacterized membrane protein YfcA|nr:sulfite exporter TauE/SafE family protein [Coriobacteriia bacterium]